MTRETYEAEIFKHLRRVSLGGEKSSDGRLLLEHQDRSVTSPEAKQLIQYSRLILAIYGGAIMALLGSLPSQLISRGNSGTSSSGRQNEDLLLLDFARDDPQPAADQPQTAVSTDNLIATKSSGGPDQPFSYVNLLAGTYDHFLLHDAAGVPSTSATVGSYSDNIPESLDREGPKNTSRPGYYVIVSEESKKVIVVMRGTITLGDVATDLTCESQCIDTLFNDVPKGSVVHSGMLVTALAIGRPGQAVHRAVRQALIKHPDYDLDLVGHSLGAGVVGLLSLMWASPLTGKTRSNSGFGDHKVHAYCYAVPCLMDAKLGEHCTSIITSFVSSWDLVSRLSLGSITDIRNALAWLCHWENTTDEDFNCGTFIRNTLEHQTGRLDSSVSGKSRFEQSAETLARRIDEHRCGVHLYPPGKIFLSYQDHELQRTQHQPTALYEVNGDRKAVFDRILFAAGMLGGHLPQVYVRILTSLDSAESI
jgi:sn1-specific diacylglycerol lipase